MRGSEPAGAHRSKRRAHRLTAALLVVLPAATAGEPLRPDRPSGDDAPIVEYRLPGNRAGHPRDRPASPSPLRDDAGSLSFREADCAAALRLPWGPLEDCRQAVIAGAVGATAAVSLLAWWGQGFHSDFSVADEGWFGARTYSGGIDKLGHAWTSYVGMRLGTRALTWAGLPHRDAIRLAAGVGLGVGLGIEVLDGLSRGGQYGFSWEDLAMNLVGTGFGVLMESRPELDRHLAFRLMYRSGDKWYDRQVYVLAWRLSGLPGVGRDNPLRYLEVLAGYGARGFRSDMDFGDGDTRRRSVYVGVGLNLSELLDRWVFTGSRGSRTQRWSDEALRYLQVPGTAVARSWEKRP